MIKNGGSSSFSWHSTGTVREAVMCAAFNTEWRKISHNMICLYHSDKVSCGIRNVIFIVKQMNQEYQTMAYKVDDKGLDASVFIDFVNQVWKGEYDTKKTKEALSKTINITAYDDSTLAGCLRILSDGCYFGTITELLVLPEYQNRGIGSRLLQLAKENTPTMLYFGAQPGAESFYEENGCRKSLQSYMIERK